MLWTRPSNENSFSFLTTTIKKTCMDHERQIIVNWWCSKDYTNVKYRLCLFSEEIYYTTWTVLESNIGQICEDPLHSSSVPRKNLSCLKTKNEDNFHFLSETAGWEALQWWSITSTISRWSWSKTLIATWTQEKTTSSAPTLTECFAWVWVDVSCPIGPAIADCSPGLNPTP